MKVKFNNESDDILEIFEQGEYTDLQEGESIEEAKEMFRNFNDIFQAFEIGTLVAYLGIKHGSKIETVSLLIEFMVEDLGYKKFKIYYTEMKEVFDQTIEEYKKKLAEDEANVDAKAMAEAEADTEAITE